MSAGYEDLLATAGSALLAGLRAFEDAQRRLHPPALPELRIGLEPIPSEPEPGLSALGEASRPEVAAGVPRRFVAGATPDPGDAVCVAAAWKARASSG